MYSGVARAGLHLAALWIITALMRELRVVYTVLQGAILFVQ